jgi:hypothetical protein
MSVCANVTVQQDTTVFFCDVVATITEGGSNIVIALGDAGKEVNAPQVGQEYLIQGDPGCVDTFGKFQGRTAAGWQFENLE